MASTDACSFDVGLNIFYNNNHNDDLMQPCSAGIIAEFFLPVGISVRIPILGGKHNNQKIFKPSESDDLTHLIQ